jgi:Ala-tRNA(Pro) deacylase
VIQKRTLSPQATGTKTCDDPAERRARVATDDVKRALDEGGAPYELLPHTHTESALDEAKALGVDPAEVGKTLVLSIPEGYVRAIIPANCRVDVRKVREVVGGGKKQVHLATEDDLSRDYPEFDLGAVPPVGGSRQDRVILDRRLAERESVTIEAGSHDESVRIPTAELVRVARAEVADICQEE